MKILHTSDWHLGRSLYGRKRYAEFELYLDWLAEEINRRQIDALLVSGDIFDNATPSNRAQELYYRFLYKVSGSCCRHIVIVAGNHDSPSFLDAPKPLLHAMNVHVTGAITDRIQDEIVVLKDISGAPEAICLAVPYLRDRDIRTVEAGETLDDKNAKLVEGVRAHYAQVCDAAMNLKVSFSDSGKTDIPIIATGHLFAAGGKTVDGDGVRDLYVGSLAHIRTDVFPKTIDYVALGHLHVPQRVGGFDHIRYSGSPLAMGFGEAEQKKKVILVDFVGDKPVITALDVPCFQPLDRICGDLETILAGLERLKLNGSRSWLEIEYTGRELVPDLREQLETLVEGSAMEIRRIRNRQVFDRVIRAIEQEETLDDLLPAAVFSRCLDAVGVLEEDRQDLMASYQDILRDLEEEDVRADQDGES